MAITKPKEIEQECLSINKILTKLVELDCNSENYKNSIESISKDFINFYKVTERHSYSEVSRFFLQIKDEDIEYLYGNLDSVENLITDINVKKQLIRLKDHLKLEELRVDYIRKNLTQHSEETINSVQSKIEDYYDKFYEIRKSYDDFLIKYEEQKKAYEILNDNYKEQKKSYKDLNDNYEEQKKNIDGLNNQIISIIGIFSAIVITFFGGANFLQGVLENLHNVSKYRIIFTSLIISFVIFNTIFMLLNFISKILGKEISSKKCKDDFNKLNRCSNCSSKNKLITCLKEKYPIVFWFNIICIFLLISIIVIFYLDKYNILSKVINNDFFKSLLKH